MQPLVFRVAFNFYALAEHNLHDTFCHGTLVAETFKTRGAWVPCPKITFTNRLSDLRLLRERLLQFRVITWLPFEQTFASVDSLFRHSCLTFRPPDAQLQLPHLQMPLPLRLKKIQISNSNSSHVTLSTQGDWATVTSRDADRRLLLYRKGWVQCSL